MTHLVLRLKRLTGMNKNTLRGTTFLLLLACCYTLFFSNLVTAEEQSVTTDASERASAPAEAGALAVEVPASLPPATIAPEKPTAVSPPPVRVGSGSQLASVALGLVFIVALILALGWFMRRFNQGGIFNNSAIKIVATLPMGTRERLAVIDVGGQQLLLGITATQITTLHVFAEPVIDAQTNAPVSSEFGRKLIAILQQKTANGSTSTKDKSTV